jgi:hypothetical protein
VHENVSPTYAEPKAGGRVRRGERTKESGLSEGNDNEADWLGYIEGLSVGEGDGVGSGCWIEREGRERLLPINIVSQRGGYYAYRRTFSETEWGSFTPSMTEPLRWCAILICPSSHVIEIEIVLYQVAGW